MTKDEGYYQKAIRWVQKPENLILVLILLAALAIKFYFFWITQDQTLWWDEAEYMSTAKKWAFGVPYDLNPQRPPLFQFMSALMFMSGLGEVAIRFLLVLVPAVFLVFSFYLLGKEMKNKKTGLIMATLCTFSWTLLFWGARVQPDFLSLSFQVLAIWAMWKHWKVPSMKWVILAGVFSAIAFYFKVSALLVPIIFAVFLVLKERNRMFTNKNNWIYAAAFFITLIPYFIWSQVTFGTPFAFREGYSNAVGAAVPFGWYNLGFFYSLTGGVLFVLFLIGLFIALRFILYLDIIAKDRRAAFNPEIFSIISLVIVSAFYIFYIRGTEDRWVFLWLPFIFFFVSNSIDKISELVEKYAKGLGIIILVSLLLIVVYSQYTHGNELILNKKDSYAPIKQAALWMKDNSNKTDLIVSASITQTTYYSERNVSTFSSAAKTPEEFNQFIYQNEPRFIEVSAFEGQPEWLNSWIDVNQKSLNPVKVYYADPARTQPIVIIYQIMYSN